MKALIILSGKGGTGKTTVASAFIELSRAPAFADCDVDAADLHLVLSPTVVERHECRSGHDAVIREARESGASLIVCADPLVRGLSQRRGGTAALVRGAPCPVALVGQALAA